MTHGVNSISSLREGCGAFADAIECTSDLLVKIPAKHFDLQTRGQGLFELGHKAKCLQLRKTKEAKIYRSRCHSLRRVKLWCTTFGAQRLVHQRLLHNVWCNPVGSLFHKGVWLRAPFPPLRLQKAFGVLSFPITRPPPTPYMKTPTRCISASLKHDGLPHTRRQRGSDLCQDKHAFPPSPLRASYARLEHGADTFPLRVDANHMHFDIRGTWQSSSHLRHEGGLWPLLDTCLKFSCIGANAGLLARSVIQLLHPHPHLSQYPRKPRARLAGKFCCLWLTGRNGSM